MEIVERWALTNRTARSLDTSAVLGSLNIGGAETAAVRSANINQLFDNPEAVLGWLAAGEHRRAPITMEICNDLKQAWRRWKNVKSKRED